MRKAIFLILILGLLLAACGGSAQNSTGEDVLTVSGGSNQKIYTVDALQALPQTQSEFNWVTYIGVRLAALLEDAGLDVNSVTSVTTIASDGYSLVYEPPMFMREDVILAYAQANGPLSGDDGAFRMVLPGEEGKLNVRMVIELKATP